MAFALCITSFPYESSQPEAMSFLTLQAMPLYSMPLAIESCYAISQNSQSTEDEDEGRERRKPEGFMRAGDGSRLAEAGGPSRFMIDNSNQACNLELADVVDINLPNFWVGV